LGIEFDFACFRQENVVNTEPGRATERTEHSTTKETLMKTACWRDYVPALAVTLLFLYAGSAGAQGPNLALMKPLASQSGEWNGTDQYNGSHVTDGLVCEIDQNEGGSGVSSYWLGREGALNENIIIDLGVATLITEIHMRNTHNAQYNDRNTMDFVLNADNNLTSCTIGTQTISGLANPVPILMGVLSDVDGITCPDEIPPDIFDSTTGLMTGGVKYRYLQFVAVDSYHTSNNCGLNELEVYGSQ
jgi:hypothetical protein